jgi:heme A synthase
MLQELLAVLEWYHVLVGAFFAAVLAWLLYLALRKPDPNDRLGPGPWCLALAVPSVASDDGVIATFAVVCLLVGLAAVIAGGGLACFVVSGTDPNDEAAPAQTKSIESTNERG